MLRINLICIGKIKDKFYTDAIAEYAKRLGAFCRFTVTELAEERVKSNTPNAAQIGEVLAAEGKRILQKTAAADYVIALCIEGRLQSSEELAQTLAGAAVVGKSTVDFIIGGSYGLSDAVKARADLRLSMSRMTFPHQLARVILTEQIYRAFEINSGGKYHK